MLHTFNKWLRHLLFGKCPNCGVLLSTKYHDYNHKWQHCRNCGWCSYHKHYTGRQYHE